MELQQNLKTETDLPYVITHRLLAAHTITTITTLLLFYDSPVD